MPEKYPDRTAQLTPSAGPDDFFAAISAAALGCVLVFSVLTFGKEQWPTTALHVSIYAIGIAWLARYVLARYNFRLHVLMAPLAAATLWGLLQLALKTSVYEFATWNAILNWSANFVLFTISFQVFLFPKPRRKFLRWGLYFTFAVTIAAVMQHFISRTSAFFVNRDHFAAFVELFLPLAIFTALRSEERFWLHAAIAGTLFASLIATASRAGAVLGILEIIIVPLIASRRFTLDRKKILVMAAFAFLFTAILGWQVALGRLSAPNPYRYRREMVLSAAAMIRERPWFGFGLGTWETAYPAYALFDMHEIVWHAHNDWAEWAAEGGIPFFLITLSVLALSLPLAVRSIWGLGVIAVFLHSLVSFPMQLPPLASLVFVLLAAAAASERQESTGTHSKLL